jgi:hypothetical protein
MKTSEVTSVEELAKSGALRGRLSAVSFPQLLAFLRSSERTGVLSLVNAGVRKSVYFKDGKVVFAGSSLTQDRLGEVLLRGGKISADEYLRLSNRIRGGQRLGKALVEGKVLSPKDLWWAIEQQIREIVWSLFTWEDGFFQFDEDDRPTREKITVDLDVESLILEGIRRVDSGGSIRHHFCPMDFVLEKTDKDSPMELEPHEKHVLDLVIDERTVDEVCRESEIGEAETLKVIHAFVSVGVLKVGQKEAPLASEGEDEDDFTNVIEVYNEMYRHLFRHMSGEVGPIAEIILEKYLNELKERPGSIFERVRLNRDGTLDPQQLEKNILEIDEAPRRREDLIEALNELLYAELLAVKRTLGASHESQLIQVFREMREKL